MSLIFVSCVLFPPFVLKTKSGGIQAGLFSTASPAFIICVQPNLEPDPNDMTAAYMQILIHTVNCFLSPDASASFLT